MLFIESIKSLNFVNILTVVSILSLFITISYSKFDDRRSKAVILVLEIGTIENSLKLLRDYHEENNYYDTRPVTQTQNWSNYKHLFVKFLDQDDMNLMDTFFDLAFEIEQERVIASQSLVHSIESKIDVIQQRVSEFAAQSGISDDEYNLKVREFTRKFYQDKTSFEAFAPKNKIERLIPKVPEIFTTTTFSKLKIISKKKYLLFF